MLVYKYTNLQNGKIYIGKTVRSLQERWAEHLSEALSLGSSYYFHRAIRKYGPDTFSAEIVFQGENEKELGEKEKFFINSHRSWDPQLGYNMTLGGDGVTWTPELRDRMKGKNNPFYGKTHTPEIRDRLRIANTGKKRSIESSRKKSLALKGKKQEIEFSARRITAVRNSLTSSVVREHMKLAKLGSNNPRFGVPVSQLTRQKMREAHARRREAKDVSPLSSI